VLKICSVQDYAGVLAAQKEGPSWFRMPESAYRSSPPIAQSDLSVIATSSLAHLRYEREHRRAPTAAMSLGTLVHTLVLQPETFTRDWIVQPEFSGKGSVAARAAWTDQAARGKRVIDQEDLDKARAIADRVLSHPVASQLLSGGEPELIGYWRHPVLGVDCRSMLDYVRRDRLIVDLKTSANASMDEFSRSVFDRRYGYYRQGAFYWDAYTAIQGHPPEGYLLVVVESSAPYEVAIYAFDPEVIEAGRLAYMVPLAQYRDVALQRGIWAGYPTEIQTMTIPTWMRHRI